MAFTPCPSCGKPLDGVGAECVSPECNDMERWVLVLIERLDLNIVRWATMPNGRLMWACMDECTCLFIVDDTDYLDRYSMITDDGPCAAYQDCPCHVLPRRNPATNPESAIPFATDVADRRVRLAAVLATYDVTKVDGDPGDAARIDDQAYVLVEENNRDGEVFVTLHESPALAMRYQVTQDHREDWRPVRLVNLDTGDGLAIDDEGNAKCLRNHPIWTGDGDPEEGYCDGLCERNR